LLRIIATENGEKNQPGVELDIVNWNPITSKLIWINGLMESVFAKPSGFETLSRRFNNAYLRVGSGNSGQLIFSGNIRILNFNIHMVVLSRQLSSVFPLFL
jgi:hypothetical protein